MSLERKNSTNKVVWKLRTAAVTLAAATQLFSACSSDEWKEQIEKYFVVQPGQSITSIVKDSLNLSEEERSDPRLCHFIVQSVISDNQLENPDRIHPWDSIRVVPDHIQSTIEEYKENERQKALIAQHDEEELNLIWETSDGGDDELDNIPTGELTLKWWKVPEKLQGSAVWDLYSAYIWGPYHKDTKKWDWIRLWEKRTWDKNKAIANLYHKKMQRENKKKFVVATQHYNNTVSKIDFNKVHPISLDQYKKNIATIISDLRKGMDWNLLWEKMFKWDSKKLNLLKKIADNIDENVLTSYSMTEFFPYKEGDFNKEFLDFLLQNAWEEYLSYLPAVHDDYTSFWQYQFTSLALFDTPKEKRGASVINQFVPENLRIPWSVCKLKGKSHHRAAFLFSLYNITQLISKNDPLTTKALNELTKKENKSDLTQLIAIMNNLPKNWKTFLDEWYKLRTDKAYYAKKTKTKKWKAYNYDLNGNHKVDLYESFLWSNSHTYGKKTYIHYNSLKK